MIKNKVTQRWVEESNAIMQYGYLPSRWNLLAINKYGSIFAYWRKYFHMGGDLTSFVNADIHTLGFKKLFGAVSLYHEPMTSSSF